MKVEVISVHNEGGFNDEYVDFKATEACNLSHVMVADTTYTKEGKISNKVRHTYWFPPTQVNRGDFIRLYTRPKRATDETSWQNKANTTTHIFFWNLHAAIWNDSGDGVVLFQIDTWKTTKVE
jgi:hypothetical protein